MIDGWCRQRDTEANNPCRSRIYVVDSFVRFLNGRGLSPVQPPQIPRKETVIRKMTIPVFFRLLYSSGIRTNEAGLLPRENADPERGILDIQYCFQHKVIEEWLVWLRESRGCSPESCNNRLASLRTFLKYLGSRDVAYLHFYLEAARIRRRKCQKKKVEGLTREAVKALLDAPGPLSRTGRRDMAFLILLYSTAVRLDELLSMKNSQLHLSDEKPYAVIIGKGNKSRTLYLLPKTVAHLKRYLAEFHEETPDPEAYVFYSRNTGCHGKLTQPAISRMLGKYAKTAHEACSDVPLGLHAHQLRHSKASHWLEDGMNIIQISFLLSHEQLQTTMVYLDITAEEKSKALATLENENDRNVSAKWKNPDGSLVDFCGIKRKR